MAKSSDIDDYAKEQAKAGSFTNQQKNAAIGNKKEIKEEKKNKAKKFLGVKDPNKCPTCGQPINGNRQRVNQAKKK